MPLPVPAGGVVLVGPDAAALSPRFGVPFVATLRAFRGRPGLVHLAGPLEELGREALWATLRGARGVLATPRALTTLPWWHRRIHRFVVATQAEAQALGAAGVDLGRVVLAGDPEVAAGVYAEVAAMGSSRRRGGG